MSQVATATIKTNQTSFELIPEEDSSAVADIMDQQNKGHVAETSDASAQQAAQAAFAARIIAAQQNLAAGNLPELALFSQQQQLIQHRILEEQIARSREFLLQQETNSGEGKPAFGAIFHQVSLSQFKDMQAALSWHTWHARKWASALPNFVSTVLKCENDLMQVSLS